MSTFSLTFKILTGFIHSDSNPYLNITLSLYLALSGLMKIPLKENIPNILHLGMILDKKFADTLYNKWNNRNAENP